MGWETMYVCSVLQLFTIINNALYDIFNMCCMYHDLYENKGRHSAKSNGLGRHHTVVHGSTARLLKCSSEKMKSGQLVGTAGVP